MAKRDILDRKIFPYLNREEREYWFYEDEFLLHELNNSREHNVRLRKALRTIEKELKKAQ